MPEIATIEFEQLHPEVIFDPRGPCYDYNQQYFDDYQQRADSDTGHQIHEHRRYYVQRHSHPDVDILDYGCGYGEIVHSDTTGRWYGYDVMPQTAKRLGDKFDPIPRIERYGSVCFFDVLEHLPCPQLLLSTVRKGARIFIVLPCWDDWEHLEKIQEWKHFKPGEHILYASQAGLISLVEACGYSFIERDDSEVELGREDVYGFVFEKGS